MIQFNLLPEVKIKYIKARRQKRMVMLIAFIVSAGSLAVVVLVLSYVYLIQGAQIGNLNDKITRSTNSIRAKKGQVDDINKVLTVQNQLTSLDNLHESKPSTSRIFEYLSKVTPSQVTISKLAVSNIEGAEIMSIQGSTDTLETINRFVDTLKFTTFETGVEGDKKKQIFTEVVLTSFSRDKAGAAYSLDLKFDPIIFNQAYPTTGLVVPEGLITTRSELGRPVLQTETERINNAPTPAEGK